MSKNDSDWDDVLPKKRANGMGDLRGNRHVVILRPNGKILYLSEKVTASLAVPKFIGLKVKRGTTMVGLYIATKETGYTVKYEEGSKVGSLSIKSFADQHPEWQPGMYEAIRETVNRVDDPSVAYELIVFSMDKPTK